MRVSSIRQVDHAYVVEYREWRLSTPIGGKGPKKFPAVRTVNLEIATLRAMLNRGVEWKRIGRNPIADLKPLVDGEPRKSRRPLTNDEVSRLFDASPKWLIAPLQVLAATGLQSRTA